MVFEKDGIATTMARTVSWEKCVSSCATPLSARSTRSPSPALRGSTPVLQPLHPNNTDNARTTPTSLSLTRDLSWELPPPMKRQASQQGEKVVAAASQPRTESPCKRKLDVQTAPPLKRMRPTLTIDIPRTPSQTVHSLTGVGGSAGSESLSLRRTFSWEAGEGPLAMRRTVSWEEGTFGDTSPGERALSREEEGRAKAWVKQLAQNGVRLLCFDFDLTLITMHTGGKWWGSASTLARAVRPLFKAIIPEAKAQGIEVCVVTKSQQSLLVSKVLQIAVPCDLSGLVVRGGMRGLFKEDGEPVAMPLVGGARGKQAHIESVLQWHRESGCGVLQNHEVMLVDDDFVNVDEALGAGMRALLFSIENPLHLCAAVDEMDE